MCVVLSVRLIFDFVLSYTTSADGVSLEHDVITVELERISETLPIHMNRMVGYIARERVQLRVKLTDVM